MIILLFVVVIGEVINGEKKLNGITTEITIDQFPHIIDYTFENNLYYEPYSFTANEWSNFDNLLEKTKFLCSTNETFAASWTKPIKCEYYLIINRNI
jgi:hypothetical protein